MNYSDKNGNKIEEADSLLFADGTTETVYSCMTQEGELDLGINASNEDYMRNQNLGEWDREYYSLSDFNLHEVEIIDEPFQEIQMKESY